MPRSLEASHDEAIKEKETLKDEEDTSTATGEAEENEDEDEEDTSTNESESSEGEEDEDSDEEKVTLTKAEHDKLIQERDNYKQGMLAAKGKKRADTGLVTTKSVPSVNEEAVVKVLSKREEQKALRNTIDSKHSDYIPELVDDNQYQEIIGYLPRNVDKTSYDSIVRGLKIATKMWKEERGIKDKSPKKDTGLQNSKSSTASNNSAKIEKKQGERKILKKAGGVNTWFN